jgi:uncharacterized protein YbjT (DUF2867 family)
LYHRLLLQTKNVIIRAAIHSQNKADKFKQYNKTVQIVNMDYNKPETIADALNQVDKLFLLTLPTPSVTDICSDLVKEVRKNGGIKHIAKLSTMSVDRFGTTIERLHKQEEKIIEESVMPYTFLHPGPFM